MLTLYHQHRLDLLKRRCGPCPSNKGMTLMTVQCSEKCGCPDGQTLPLLTAKCPKGIEVHEYEDIRSR